MGDGAKNRVGPQLNGVMGRTIGSVDDFRYSKTMALMGEEGQVWDEQSIAGFLADPRGYVKGTKMSLSWSEERRRYRGDDRISEVFLGLIKFKRGRIKPAPFLL